MKKGMGLFLLALATLALLLALSSCFVFSGKTYLPPQVTLKSPANNATGLDTNVTLRWDATPGAVQTAISRQDIAILGYIVYFAKDTEAYGSPEITIGKQLEKTGLEHSTTYKWKVTAKQNDGKSATSVEWKFTTGAQSYSAPQVELVSPLDGATDQATALTLTWEATPGNPTNTGARVASIEEYQVFFATATSALSTPHGTTTLKSYEISGLDYETEYKWKVQALQSDGATATSDEATFSTLQRPFDGLQLVLKTPANASTNQATALTLTWEATPGTHANAGARVETIDEYWVYFATSTSAFTTPHGTTTLKTYDISG
ncbi:MAG TPA: hypothetical protein PLF96_14420, partial [Thermotogota bacterium]|nr:hypothetical protein [Thermotogota bacterium]